jgi:hypothetical protein
MQVERAVQDKQSAIVRAQGEAQSARLIGQAIQQNPAFITLRKIEVRAWPHTQPQPPVWAHSGAGRTLAAPLTHMLTHTHTSHHTHITQPHKLHNHTHLVLCPQRRHRHRHCHRHRRCHRYRQAARDIASTISQSANRVFLNADSLLLNLGDVKPGSSSRV